MAKLNTREIREAAKAILEKYPTGLRFTPLWKQIASEHPETNQNIIFTQVTSLARDESARVVKPSRGVYQLTKYAEAGSTVLLTAPRDGEALRHDSGEQDYYLSFADWLRDELREATVAAPLGGARNR